MRSVTRRLVGLAIVIVLSGVPTLALTCSSWCLASAPIERVAEVEAAPPCHEQPASPAPHLASAPHACCPDGDGTVVAAVVVLRSESGASTAASPSMPAVPPPVPDAPRVHRVRLGSSASPPASCPPLVLRI